MCSDIVNRYTSRYLCTSILTELTRWILALPGESRRAPRPRRVALGLLALQGRRAALGKFPSARDLRIVEQVAEVAAVDAPPHTETLDPARVRRFRWDFGFAEEPRRDADRMGVPHEKLPLQALTLAPL